MSEKYIRKNGNSYNIVRNSKNYGKFQNLDDAVFIRDELIKKSWDLDSLDEVYFLMDNYLVVKVIEEKIHILAKFRKKPSEERIEKLYKKRLRNPNNSKYGLNITKVLDTFIIRKQIAGDEYVFGYYDSLEDAQFVRNHLLENGWNVNAFSQIQYDEDNKNYKVTEIIDDKVYVLDSFSKKEIDLDKCHEEFLNKITKHSSGLARHPHLDELTGRISQLEEKFNIKTTDDVWSFEKTDDPLNDIIFSLTPFQQSVYDSVDDSTIEEIEKSLIRFKSRNFTQKIQKNLDELADKGLITKKQNHYLKQKR